MSPGRGRPGGAPSRAWVDEQRALHEAYLGRRPGVERHLVKILWWTVAADRRPDMMGVLSRLWSGRSLASADEQTFVALYDPADPVGARPFLVARVAPGSFPEAGGRGVATAVGTPTAGGALVIETRRGAVLPAEPPGLPGDDAPAWSEVDAPG